MFNTKLISMTVPNTALAIHMLMNELVIMVLTWAIIPKAAKESWAKMIVFMNDTL